jgi:6,7-dimethyl-8-ribityllumazine synthase
MNRMDDLDERENERVREDGLAPDDLERSSENVLEGWPGTDEDAAGRSDAGEVTSGLDAEEPLAAGTPESVGVPERLDEPDGGLGAGARAVETSSEHAPGALVIPPGYPVLEGEARSGRRAVGIVVSRFNGEVTGGLLDSALDELRARGVDEGSITVMPVPGAFELPLAAMALAKTRRFACIVALGCVIRGDTPHFDYVASEAASGLQLAAIETGVPVAFGVLTLDRHDQAQPRLAKGAEAVRTALEMADLFSNLRAAAAR